jgi:tRNA threonylcarbamoyladenosine biosynthesis protein TsaB
MHHDAMKILAIDTSTPAGGVAITEGDSVLANVFDVRKQSSQGAPVSHASEEFSSKLFRYVDSLLKEVRLGLPDIDIFAVTAGPGSFTGLRVGLTAVKAWSEVYGKPIAAISALEAVAAQSLASSGLIAAYTDARRGQVFWGLFERSQRRLNSLGEESVMRPQEFIESVMKLAGGQSQGLDKGSNQISPVKFVSPAPEIIADALAESPLGNSVVEKVSEDLAPWVGRLAFGRAQRGELVYALTLDANYVRRMDAELYWKDS